MLTLLAAYREAAESLRQAIQASKPALEPVADDVSDASTDDAREVERALPRGLPAVPRLHVVAGIAESDLAQLHGQLVANGFVTVEILGRTDGLAYRLTRDGVRQLDGEPAMADAA